MEKPEGQAQRRLSFRADLHHGRHGGNPETVSPLRLRRDGPGQRGRQHPHDGCRPPSGFRGHRGLAAGGWRDSENLLQRRCGQHRPADPEGPAACRGDGLSRDRIHLRRPAPQHRAGGLCGRAGRAYPENSGSRRKHDHPLFRGWQNTGDSVFYPGDQRAPAGPGTR